MQFGAKMEERHQNGFKIRNFPSKRHVAPLDWIAEPPSRAKQRTAPTRGEQAGARSAGGPQLSPSNFPSHARVQRTPSPLPRFPSRAPGIRVSRLSSGSHLRSSFPGLPRARAMHAAS